MAGSVQVVDKGLNRLLRSWRKLVAASGRMGPSVTVGIQGTEGEQPREKGAITNLSLGLIHEFGAPSVGIPARSFVRSTVDVNRSKYQRALSKIGKALLKGKDPRQLLFVLGETARGDMIKRIQTKQIKQDLQPATLRRRKEAEGPALVDTGQLINAITSVVHL